MRLWIWRWQYEVYKWLHFTVYFIENKMVDISYTEYYDHDRTEILKRDLEDMIKYFYEFYKEKINQTYVTMSFS